jgi:predicted double-glycine peptidase
LRRVPGAACGGLAALVLLGGCSSVASFKGLPLNEDAVYVNGVTPIRQDHDFTCGPACLAAVATHWGVSPAQFKASATASPRDFTARDLQALAGRLGLQAFVYGGSMDDLRENLGKGRPVIAMISMPLPPQGDLITAEVLALWNEVGPRPAHWVVVVGMIGQKWVILDDPASGPLVVRADRFQKWWAQRDSVAVLVTASVQGGSAVSLNP